ncbi:IBR domain-containing protein [Colletotrichum simmondsii]|uniref:IBR domain-containing protein n=1 Tax=Colletotrichum simmondsii TaxID=703756 RepID=A0A135TZM1_9PEZI|nr:IBR domain-containing protein [Colletotrichum simmondsii]
MDLFQRLNEDVTNIIIEHGFLNLDTLRFATEREVERAAVRALEMATPDQQLAIAMRQSAMGIEGDDAIINEDENEANDNDANNNADNVVNEDTGGYIGWEERNRLLTDTRNNSAETSDAEDNNNNDRTECVVCFTARQPLHRLPCGCQMCPRCLRRCLRAGLRPGGWPPRCCQPLAPENVEQAAGGGRPRLVRLYRQVRVEEETPGEERVYCARPECAAFIPAAGGATCLACGQGTCRQCRRPLHPGQLCGTEAEDAALMDVMDELHLSPCPSCRRIIERAGGCTHMTGGRVNMRDRRTTYRQGQLGEDGRLVVPTPVLQYPPFYPPPPPPPPQPPQVQPEVQPEVQPQAQPFPQANLDGIPQPQVQGFQPVGEIPFIDHRNVYDMDREARPRQGRGRFSIIMYYPDGRNTEKPESGALNPAPTDADHLPSRA